MELKPNPTDVVPIRRDPGLALLILATRGSAWQGAGFGLAMQAGLVLQLDSLAELRAQTYLEWLQAF